MVLIGEDRATRILFETVCDDLGIELVIANSILSVASRPGPHAGIVVHVEFGRHLDAVRRRSAASATASWWAACTADARPSTLGQLVEGGFDAVLVKPLSLTALRAKLIGGVGCGS